MGSGECRMRSAEWRRPGAGTCGPHQRPNYLGRQRCLDPLEVDWNVHRDLSVIMQMKNHGWTLMNTDLRHKASQDSLWESSPFGEWGEAKRSQGVPASYPCLSVFICGSQLNWYG